ncbi:uncharacterized protein METZ01_LOCUS22084 [marine metagenome]|uniref:Uncharacterized protein n=1 Tax=marine metagenome TaxID=408172 RepID=A0A381PQN7_9ZZZZ
MRPTDGVERFLVARSLLADDAKERAGARFGLDRF